MSRGCHRSSVHDQRNGRVEKQREPLLKNLSRGTSSLTLTFNSFTYSLLLIKEGKRLIPYSNSYTLLFYLVKVVHLLVVDKIIDVNPKTFILLIIIYRKPLVNYLGIVVGCLS